MHVRQDKSEMKLSAGNSANSCKRKELAIYKVNAIYSSKELNLKKTLKK